MLTSNGKRWLLAMINAGGLNINTLKDYTGSVSSAGYSISNNYLSSITSYINENSDPVRNSNTYVIVGSGTTPETEDDYCLESPYTKEEVSISSSKVGIETYNGIDRLYVTVTLNNISGATLTVSEVGLYKCGANSKLSLLAREVFDSPMNVADGEKFTVNIIIA